MRNLARAKEYFHLAIDAGCVYSLNSLAVIYSELVNNNEKAVKYFMDAVKLGSYDAMLALGYYYHDIEAYNKAIKYLKMVTNGIKQPADKKVPDDTFASAANKLADTYTCINKHTSAIRYYKLAAEKGIPEAYNSIANIYYEHMGLYDKAIEYYHIAMGAGINDPESIYKLASIYDSVNGDFDNADKYYLMAYDLGYRHATLNLAEMYLEHARVAADYAKSAKYFMYAVNMGNKYGFIGLLELFASANSAGIVHTREDLNLTENDITAIINLVKQHPNNVRHLVSDHHITLEVLPEWFRGPWESLLAELKLMPDMSDPTYMNYFSLKQRHQAKQVECGVCLSDGPVTCIPFNWCMHYVCLTCYPKLWDKPCPFCRLD
jgi:TPR repeat protein